MSSTPVLRRHKRAASASAPPALTTVGGYRLLRRLGSGGMADVYLAYDEDRGGPIAIKVLPDDLAKNSMYVDRFRREADIGRLISHPNMVKCLDGGVDSDSGRHFLVMEFVKGQSAQAKLEQSGRFPLSEAIRICIDIARALEDLHHRGYVHRDVKPGNILVGDDGRAKLADLGVAKQLIDGQDLTSIDQGIGTPYYMPWEQTLNASLVDKRSDLFALGATLYHLVTGRVPFPGKTVQEVSRLKDEGKFVPIREIDPALPRTIDTIMAKCLARMPGERFQNASELIDVLNVSGLADGMSDSTPLAATDKPPAKTKPDMKSPAKPRGTKQPVIWQVKFQSPDGDAWRRVKGTEQDVARWFEEGLLPDEFFVARDGQKVYTLYRSVPTFENLQRRPKPEEKPKKKRFGLFGLMLGASLVTTASTSMILRLLLTH